MAFDPNIDAAIAAAPPFAQPILTHLRALVHATFPDIDEGIKWGMPHFLVNGKNLAGMQAFKAHCAFVIHGDGRQGESMGGYGKVASLADLPADDEIVAALIAARDRIVTQGTAIKKKPAASKVAKPETPLPDDFAAALTANCAAQATLTGFAPSHRREYIDWIVEAKRPETRAKRISQAVEWLAEGKKRNWKYENC